MTREYLKVVPSTGSYDPDTVPDVLRSLQSITLPDDGDSSILSRLFGKPSGATFEFIALSAGADAPVEFYYGTEASCLATLETKLQNLYPRSFTITEEAVDPARRIAPHVQYDEGAFQTAVDDDALWTTVESTGEDSIEDALETTVPSADRASLAGVDGPVRCDDGSILARPAPELLRPVGLRWHGVGARRRDWMCRLSSYYNNPNGQDTGSHPPLAELIDQLGEADIPLAFQVVFRRQPSWEGKREKRTLDIRRGEDSRPQQFGKTVNRMLTGTEFDIRDREELGETAQRRLAEMDSVDAGGTFVATVRALTLQVDPEHGPPLTDSPDLVATDSADENRPTALHRLRGTLGTLDGEFYELKPRPFRDEGLLSYTRHRKARAAFKRFQNSEVYRSTRGRSRPQAIVTPDALASLVTVPSADDLTVPAQRETRTTLKTETPLPRPNPDRLSDYREGMAVGPVLDSTREPEDELLRIPQEALTKHYARYGPTGTGKSKATQNDILSLHATTNGPVVLIDRKGDGMIPNYMRAHYARFGDLENVYCLSIPDMLPAVPFFDVRPGIAAGRERAAVAQERVEHFREILRLIMGEEQFEQAFVANEVLTFLAKILFDPHQQYDAFGLDDLRKAARAMQVEQKVPLTSPAFEETADSLVRQFEKTDANFQQTMSAVLNRLDKLRENTHLAEVLRSVPEWDETTKSYESGTFDFRRILDEDAVVLIDMGDLRRESSRALTLVLLSNLWDALRHERGDPEAVDVAETGLVNLIIEEAAPVVASPLVHEDLLPKGRAFGLGLGMVMQFPEQVRTAAGHREIGNRGYEELLHNVHTQIVGGIHLSDAFAETLLTEGYDTGTLRRRHNQLPHGEWMVDLPQTEFLNPPAQPLSVQSLPIPAGHPESDAPLSPEEEESFASVHTDVLKRSRQEFAIDSGRRDTGSFAGQSDGTPTETDATGGKEPPFGGDASLPPYMRDSSEEVDEE